MNPVNITYRHYKGGIYNLLYIGTHTETEEKFVIYTGLYDSSGTVWIRPYDMFFGGEVVADSDGQDSAVIDRFIRHEVYDKLTSKA